MNNTRYIHSDRFYHFELCYGDSEEELSKAIKSVSPGAGYVWSIKQKWEADGLFFAFVMISNSCD